MNWLKRLLKSIEKANDESFKGTKMDCCELNRKCKGKNNRK